MTNNGHLPEQHTTPLTPPPAYTPAPAPVAAPESPVSTASQSPGGKAILVVTAIVGGIALLASGGTAAAAAVVSASSESSGSGATQTIDVAGIDEIDLEVNASDVRVRFADVDEAELAVINGRGSGWTLDRDDNELTVRSPDRAFGWWFGGWSGADETAVLTLPLSLSGAGLDGSFTLSAGSLDIEGEFGDLEVEVNAGDLSIDGSAASFDLEVSAGGADIVLGGVREADLGLSAGDVTVELTGTAPRETSIDVSAGSLELTLADAQYNISQDISAGTLDNGLDHSSNAERRIDVTLSAGTVTLIPQR